MGTLGAVEQFLLKTQDIWSPDRSVWYSCPIMLSLDRNSIFLISLCYCKHIPIVICLDLKVLILNKAKIFSSLWTAARRHVLSIFHYPRGFTAICPLLPPPYPPQFLVSNLPLFFTAMGNCRENSEKEVNFKSLFACKGILFKILRIKQLFVIPQILVIGSI